VAEIQLHADGFSFSPYLMLVAIPFLPVPLQIHAHDTCRWDAAHQQIEARSRSV
jgi:hypothetical protein